MAASQVVQWPGLCFLANMLFCAGITACKAFISELCFVLVDLYLFCAALVWLLQDFSESLGSCHHAQRLTVVRGLEGLVSPGRTEFP